MVVGELVGPLVISRGESGGGGGDEEGWRTWLKCGKCSRYGMSFYFSRTVLRRRPELVALLRAQSTELRLDMQQLQAASRFVPDSIVSLPTGGCCSCRARLPAGDAYHCAQLQPPPVRIPQALQRTSVRAVRSAS